MLFSICTPVFNGLSYLPRCIGSVRGQTHPNVEHLVQDGGSTDGTVEWLREQRGLDWKTEADNGMYDAIMRGWARAHGDVLSWLNADEQYLPETLSVVRRVFAANPKADVVFGNMIIVTRDGDPLAARREIPLRGVYVRNGSLYASSCVTFFRRSLLDRGLLSLDPKLTTASDAKMVLDLLDAGVIFEHVAAYLALFTFDGRNLSSEKSAEVEAEDVRLAAGAFRQRYLRHAVLAGRWAEKALRGYFLPTLVRYRFALDEVPNYRDVAGRVRGRYPSLESVVPAMGRRLGS